MLLHYKDHVLSLPRQKVLCGAMPVNRRKRRQKVRTCPASAYFALQVSGIPLEVESMHGAVTKALEEAYGEVGGSRYEFSVRPLSEQKNGNLSIDFVLHAPHIEQRGEIWAALTMLYEYGTKCVRIVVTKTGDTVKELCASDDGDVGNTEKERAN